MGKKKTEACSGIWQKWPLPNEDDELQIARVLAKCAVFPCPDDVSRVAKENKALGEHLREHCPAINWNLYLWDGSACVWPGVRRFVGNQHKKKTKVERQEWGTQNAWYIDDQSYVYRTLNGLYFGSFTLDIPDRNNRQLTVAPGFTICHLMDHKDDHLCRLGEVFDVKDQPEIASYGFFTSLASLVILPDWLPKPTDHSSKIRGLFLRKAHELYAHQGVSPFQLSFRPHKDSRWDTAQFEWAKCQEAGKLDYVLKERNKTICRELSIPNLKGSSRAGTADWRHRNEVSRCP